MIIAVDFDGVLVKDEFPRVGETDFEILNLVKKAQSQGSEIVVWTCRCGNEMVKCISWCADNGLHPDSINKDAPSNIREYSDKYISPPRKVYADLYIDDHSVGYTRKAAINALNKIIKEEKSNV